MRAKGIVRGGGIQLTRDDRPRDAGDHGRRIAAAAGNHPTIVFLRAWSAVRDIMPVASCFTSAIRMTPHDWQRFLSRGSALAERGTP
jgi:hypothetical protein